MYQLKPKLNNTINIDQPYASILLYINSFTSKDIMLSQLSQNLKCDTCSFSLRRRGEIYIIILIFFLNLSYYVNVSLRDKLT